jgi:hypothetical protein
LVERSCSCCFSHTSLTPAAFCLGNDRSNAIARGTREARRKGLRRIALPAAGWLNAHDEGGSNVLCFGLPPALLTPSAETAAHRHCRTCLQKLIDERYCGRPSELRWNAYVIAAHRRTRWPCSLTEPATIHPSFKRQRLQLFQPMRGRSACFMMTGVD